MNRISLPEQSKKERKEKERKGKKKKNNIKKSIHFSQEESAWLAG